MPDFEDSHPPGPDDQPDMHSSTPSSNSFHIFVKNTDQRTIVINVKNSTTIDKVKENFHIDPSQYRLLYEGRDLRSGTIQSNNIQPGSTLQMIGRLRGGNRRHEGLLVCIMAMICKENKLGG